MSYTENTVQYAAFFTGSTQWDGVKDSVSGFARTVEHSLSESEIREACQNRLPGRGANVGPDWACEALALTPLVIQSVVALGGLIGTGILCMFLWNARQQRAEESRVPCETTATPK